MSQRKRWGRIWYHLAHNPGHLLCAFWTAGFTACPPDIGSVRCNLIFQGQNRTIGCILDRSARLYGDCMEPDRMAKYSLLVLTDLTENLIQKNQLFMCWPPYSSEGVFGRVSAFCVHPCGFCLENSNIDETIGGGSFVRFWLGPLYTVASTM